MDDSKEINPQCEHIEQPDTIKNTQDNTQPRLTENLDLDKEKIIKQLKAAKNVEERIKLFSKRMDSYGIEAIVSLIPAIGDLTPAIISSCYLIVEGIHIGLSRQDCLKILGYQTLDMLIGAVPIIGDIADFFFKGNKYSSKIFSKHLEKLKKAAIKKGISQEEINSIGEREARFIKKMTKYKKFEKK